MSHSLTSTNSDGDTVYALPDGTALDVKQSRAIDLYLTLDATQDEIAELAGYADGKSMWRFLRSDKGKMGVRVALTTHMAEAGVVGLKTMIKLAKTAKSENVRQLAAADLLNRAGLVAQEGGTRVDRGGMTINIDLSGKSGDEKVIEHE